MVATYVLISLCMSGLTAAASTRPRTGRQNSEALIVNQVVSTLQPEIANAVANALAGLQFQQQQQQTFNADRQFNNGFNGGAVEQVDNNAQYSYKYQVRDDEEGTYIFKNEERNGLDVTGVYGYVAPDGTLITVNYNAGPDGFYQELEREVDFLRNGGANNQANTRVPVRPAPAPIAPAPRQPALDEAALIAQIVSALQPEITSSVNAAISQTQRQSFNSASRSVSAAAPANSGDRLVPLFGFNQA
jgi:hypothetical protein